MDTEIFSEHGDTRQGEQRVVLVIAHDFPPYGMRSAIRPFRFVKYLGDFSWRTVVLSATPPTTSFADEQLATGLAGRPVRIYRTGSHIDGIRLVQGKNDTVPYLSGRTARRLRSVVRQTVHQPDRGREWMKEALAIGREIIRVEQVEIILATAPPFTPLLLAQRLSHEFDIPFLVDYRDAWVESADRCYPTPLHRSANARLENEMLKLAEKIIVVSRHTKELLLRNYGFLEHNDVRIIPHGYDPEELVAPEHRPSHDRCVIVTTSDFTGGQSPQFFFKALKKFFAAVPDARGRVEVRFAGLLPKRDARLIRHHKLEDTVTYLGALPHAEKMRQIAEADILWLVHRDSYRMPEELYDYIGTRKPVIAAVPPGGPLATTIQDTAAAAVVRPGNVEETAEALTTLYNRRRAGTLPVGREQFAAQFDYRLLTADLSRELGLAMKLV